MTKAQSSGKSYYVITKGREESGILIASDDRALIESRIKKVSLRRTHFIERMSLMGFYVV